MAEKLAEFIAQLSADDDKVRKSAVRAIAALPSDEATKALERAASDANPGVRFLAKNALKKRKAGVIITTATAASAATATIDSSASTSTATSTATEPAHSEERPQKRERKRISTSSLKPVAKEATVSEQGQGNSSSQASGPVRTSSPAPISRRPSQSSPPATVKSPERRPVLSAPMPSDLEPLRPMGVGELLSRTLSTYKKLSWQAPAALAVLNIPIAGIALCNFVLVLLASDVQVAYSVIGFMAILALPFNLFATWFGSAVMTKMIADQISGRGVDLWSAFAFCWERKWTLFTAAVVMWVLWYLGLFVGSMALVIPGAAFAFWSFASWAFVPVVSVIEDKGSYSACERSAQLASYSWGSVFVRYFCLIFLTAIVSLLVTAPFRMILAAFNSPALSVLLGSAINLLSTVVFAPITCIGLVLLYFSQRVEFEGYSIEEMTRQLKG